MHRFLLTAAATFALAASASFAQEPAKDRKKEPRPQDASALFTTMAATTGLEAAFDEEKHLSLLAVPLTSKGKLFFTRQPDGGYLTRVVESPEPSTVRISPKELRVENRDGKETIDLQRSDKVRTFVLALVQVFSGDKDALAKSFAVAFTPDPKNAQGWTLVLTQLGKPLDQMMKSLSLVGEGTAVVRIEMLDPNGDRTVTKVTTANPARTFDAAEKKQLFGIEPR